MSEMELQLRGYRLTLAEMTYHRPDFPALLQEYVWQELDLAPGYPVLRKFLDFYQRNLDGKLHSVQVATRNFVRPAATRWVTLPLILN